MAVGLEKRDVIYWFEERRGVAQWRVPDDARVKSEHEITIRIMDVPVSVHNDDVLKNLREAYLQGSLHPATLPPAIHKADRRIMISWQQILELTQ